MRNINLIKVVFSIIVFGQLISCKNENEMNNSIISESVSNEQSTDSDIKLSSEVSSLIVSSQEDTSNDQNQINEYISLAINQLDEIITPFVYKIPNEELKKEVLNYYEKEKNIINCINDLSKAKEALNKVEKDTKIFINDTIKPLMLEKIDGVINQMIEKITYEELKISIKSFYEKEREKISSVETIEDITIVYNEIINDIENYALNETKKVAISKLNEIVNRGVNKIPNDEIKNNLKLFSISEIEKINEISSIEEFQPTFENILKETENYIKELFLNTLTDYFKELTKVENRTAYDYLPSALNPAYAKNIVDFSKINYDFTNFTNISDIHKEGYGEQWQMVVENIDQSIAIAKVLNVIQTTLNSAGNAVNIYMNNSYFEEINYSFSKDYYNADFIYKDFKLLFDIELTNDVNVPLIGIVKPIIKMEYDIENEYKEIYINLGENYKLKYVISSNEYEMATTYGINIAGQKATRTSFLSIQKNSNKTIGHIYEYTSFNNSDKIKACADFYVENGYVSVVGNKSSGMMAFDGYINELYLENEGRLLGYEVKEKITISGVTGTYNTLWFNLWDIEGINTIKITDKTDDNLSSKSTVNVYLNESSKLLSPTYNTKLKIKTSRKYDIEFRKRYYYSYDEINDKLICHELKVPMLFIQQGENFDSFKSDVKKDNNITLSISLNPQYLNKILDDYASLIDIFIINKEKMSSEEIISYLKKYE